MKIVIVGHVDHGKSTLIGRLLFDTNSLPEGKMEELKKTCESMGREMEFGFITDSFEEERDQAITIDTTQIFFRTKKRNYVIIDAPGHKEFLKNMISGASLAEAAILIVDASEGIMEQTKRHSYILGLLGLKQVIVAVNKMDLVKYDKKTFEEIKKGLEEFFPTIGVTAKYFIPVSAKKGDNIAEKSKNMEWNSCPTILEALDSFKEKESHSLGPLRFPVQDVYHIEGKRIIVGRIESGSIKEGNSVLLLPNNTETKVKSVEIFLFPERKSAVAGESIGITTSDAVFCERGQIICKKESRPKTGNEVNANIFWISKEPIAVGERITIKCATQEMRCSIKEIKKRFDSSSLELLEKNAKQLLQNEVGEVIIKTDKPIAFDSFNEIQETGRFVLEKNMDTVAGGVINRNN